MFEAAIPNLLQTLEGNLLVAQMMQAGAKRAQAQAAFYEAWARKRGSLEGAGQVWAEYYQANPMLREDGDSVAVVEQGDWRPYLDRKPANAYTPATIGGMSREELAQVPIEQLTEDQLEAMERRFMELGE
jgi:hypothetical protein